MRKKISILFIFFVILMGMLMVPKVEAAGEIRKKNYSNQFETIVGQRQDDECEDNGVLVYIIYKEECFGPHAFSGNDNKVEHTVDDYKNSSFEKNETIAVYIRVARRKLRK